jgi:Transposase DDE domain
VDAAALDAAVGSWLAGRLSAADERQDLRRPVVAVDGKAVRGTVMPAPAAGRAPAGRHRSAGQRGPRQAGVVLGQAGVDGETNEITRFAPLLLEPLDLAGTVVTADALHTQRDHAEFLVSDKKGHYIMVVKKNQPSLYA